MDDSKSEGVMEGSQSIRSNEYRKLIVTEKNRCKYSIHLKKQPLSLLSTLTIGISYSYLYNGNYGSL